MTRLFFGNKAGFGPVLKIMVNDVDDPLTTPSSAYGKYRFNSETTRLGYVYESFTVSFDTTSFPPPSGGDYSTEYYRPPGRDRTNFDWMVYCHNGQSYNYSARKFPHLNSMPIVEYRDLIGGQGPVAKHYFSHDGVSLELGVIRGTLPYTTNISDRYVLTGDWPSQPGMPLGQCAEVLFTASTPSQLVTVLELPATSAPLYSFTGTAVAGQEVLRLSSSMARLAYPGHSVTDNAIHIFSEDRSPAKILGAGEVIVVAGGHTDVFTRIPPTSTTYLDFHVRRTDTALYHPPLLPAAANADVISMTWGLLSNGIRINNNGVFDIVVRYLIIAHDLSAPTSGGSGVLRKGNDGIGDFVQIKKPGSSDTAPSAGDILVDTRLAYLPIVAEGWLNPSDFLADSEDTRLGTEKATVNFSNDGSFLPFVKYVCTRPTFEGHANPIVSPTNEFFWNYPRGNWWHNYASMNSINCRISSNKLEFWTAKNNPRSVTYSDQNGVTITPGDGVGKSVRYYVFAIPTSL